MVLNPKNRFKLWSLPLALVLIANPKEITLAQIVPDETLPQNSIVTPNGNIIKIEGGTTAGTNLFHSFEQFSVLKGQTAFFDNALTIENIIGRITGSSISEIDGLIRSLGTANLFLLNPNGIIFGENAALDIGGSFIGSTANSIKFSDGSEFSAVNPNSNSLLTVNIPIGLQYGQQNGDITVKGTGNNLFVDFDTYTVDRSERPLGLAVKPGNTLALVGGNVFIEGGNLTAPAGNLEVGSVAAGSTVSLTPDLMGQKLDYSGVSSFQQINLSQAASLEASGNSGGRVSVKGGFVSLTDGSTIMTDTLGDSQGRSLSIEAEEIEIYGAAENGFTSSLFTDVGLGATGNGGDLIIDTSYLYLDEGAQINVNTFGAGDAGNLTIGAKTIELVGNSTDGEFATGLFAQADIGETGRGGNIDIATDNLFLADGAQINVGTFGAGDAGNLTIEAKTIELLSGSSDFAFSGLFASTDSDLTGKGGNISIKTDSLYIADGAQINASTFGAGDAGNLTVEAKTIELTGTSFDGFFPSGLLTTVESEATGNGGTLLINTNNLLVRDGAQIAVSTLGSGNGGQLNIEANNIELINSGGLFSNAITGSGNGGNINLTSNKLTILDGATINASNFASSTDFSLGKGTAGNINIEVNFLELDNTSSQFPSSITASTNAGGGGEITINVAESANLSHGSQILAETLGSGDGGSVNLTAKTVNLNSQGQISTNSVGLGQAGNINITANDEINANQGKITSTSTQSGGGNINLATDFLFSQNNSLISTSVLDSTGGGGNLNIDSNYVIAKDNSDFRANAVLGQGGNIDITTEVILLSFDSNIDASSQFGLDGVVEIKSPESNEQIGVIQLPTKIDNPTELITANCASEQKNALIVTGKGGLSENPSQYLRSQSVWEDLRDIGQQTASASPDEIIEAKEWVINERGNVELLSQLPFNQCKK